MALMLGIDTGGTYTDAVLVEDGNAARLIASAKAPTTHHDLTIGVAAAVGRVLAIAAPVSAEEIAIVSVSTTLATNALVEGHGEPAGLFTFGFSDSELARIGIKEVLDADLIVRFGGGHDAHGDELEPLDTEGLAVAARQLDPLVTAFAVAAQFSVRNPGHEIAAREVIRSVTAKPVTSSHELSARLDGPRRALTAALNARLIGTIARLNLAVGEVLEHRDIRAPIMVVRGDGSLVSADFAARRPIETVLSGPAASVVGALHLASINNGLVVDIGGTTTDVAVIRGGRPAIAESGATVGGHRTMVEAVGIATAGIGGDSEVRIDSRHAEDAIVLGPERAISLSRLALEYPEIHNVLDRQLAALSGQRGHGRLLVSTAGEKRVTDQRERQLLELLAEGPLPVTEATTSGLVSRAARRLRARGLARVATMTPTDAASVVGLLDGVDRDAALKVAMLLARQPSSNGSAVAADPVEFSHMVIERLVRRSAEFVLRTALADDGITLNSGDAAVLDAALGRHHGVASIAVGLSDAVTAIGAPASAYYDSVARMLGVEAIIPEHAEVANAIGAVVGQVRVRRSATITQPTKGQFRVHLVDQPAFGSVDRAQEHARKTLADMVSEDAEAAGASNPELTANWETRTAVVGGREVFVEGTLTVEASGRPRF